MKHYLTLMVAAFLVFTSYQSVYAAANSFTSKPVRLGDNLLSILRQHGFSERQREQVLAADKNLRNLFLTLDTQYLVRKAGKDTEIKIFDSQSSEAFFIQRKGSEVIAYRFNPNFDVKILSVEGKIHGSILGTILSKVKSNWVATRFLDAYVFDMESSRKIARGARFGLTVEKLFESGQFIKYGEVLNTSLELNGSIVKKKFVKSKNGGVFFSAQDLLEQRPFFAPVEYIKVASKFKANRRHPITKRLQPHLGVDFELPIGEPVFAPRKGMVVRYGNNRAAGNYIVLQHSNGMETSYNHLYRIDRKIQQGLRVAAGEVIGQVGCTGYCTRAHLHFTVKKSGRMVDPVKYIKSYPVHMERQLEERVAVN